MPGSSTASAMAPPVVDRIAEQETATGQRNTFDHASASSKMAEGQPITERAFSAGGARGAIALHVIASLMWVPQAMLISMAIGFLANGGGVESVIYTSIFLFCFRFFLITIHAVVPTKYRR